MGLDEKLSKPVVKKKLYFPYLMEHEAATDRYHNVVHKFVTGKSSFTSLAKRVDECESC